MEQKLTVVELKAKAYDLLSEIQKIQIELQSVNAELAKAIQEQK